MAQCAPPGHVTDSLRAHPCPAPRAAAVTVRDSSGGTQDAEAEAPVLTRTVRAPRGDGGFARSSMGRLTQFQEPSLTARGYLCPQHCDPTP